MSRIRVHAALAVVLACAGAGPLHAQMQPVQLTPPPKQLSLQITGGTTIPVFSYGDLLEGFGWTAGGALVLRRGSANQVRLEGEYNSTSFSGNLTSGSSVVYGGGIGGGHVVNNGSFKSDAFFVVGAYNHDYGAGSEVQFGTKVGLNAVFGQGKVHPVLDFHWLTTFSAPYVNIISFGAGLRF